MQVNAVSHFLLTAELLPLLRNSGAARVVSQSSSARLQFKPDMARVRCLVEEEGFNGSGAPSSFNAFDQYRLSKAANCLFTQGLNKRLAEAGVDNVQAIVADPGFVATGVNIQHNLGHSVLGIPDGFLTTETMHHGAHHAADGALPMALACLDPAAANAGTEKRSFWYTVAGDLVGPPVARDAARHKKKATDPHNTSSSGSWPHSTCGSEAFWAQAQEWTGASWDI
jgi:NAD(P)-dependent dehydrogenase (short-subunit alcohol dehydrogenase family)